MADDVSIIIADVLPPPTAGATPPQFPAAALKVRGKGTHTSAAWDVGSSGVHRSASPFQPGHPPGHTLKSVAVCLTHNTP